jgi:sugar lactone lactonase YvrE
VCALALMLVLPGLAAASYPITWVWTYDPAVGQLPSGLAVDKVGNVFVTLQQLGQVRKISPDGTETLFYQFPSGVQLFGLAVDAPGNLYVAAFAGGTNLGGVYRISRDGGSASHLPGTEHIFLPNGLAFDKEGNLFVTNSYAPGPTPPAGAVWRIPRNGEAELWLQDSALLGGLGQIPNYPPMGANGIAFRNNVLYVTNTEKALVVQFPVLPDGSPGDASIIAQSPALYLSDGIALDVHGTIYDALVGQDRVMAVDPASGSVTELAGPADGIDGPASLAFGTGGVAERQSLYITNFDPLHRLHPAVLKMDVGVPGWPLP